MSHPAWSTLSSSGIFIAWMTPSGQRLPQEVAALKGNLLRARAALRCGTLNGWSRFITRYGLSPQIQRELKEISQ